MRILYISYADHRKPAAAAIHVRGIIEGLHSIGHEIELWCVDGNEFPGEIPAISQSTKAGSSFNFAKYLAAKLRDSSGNFDAVIVRDFYFASPIFKQANLSGVPMILELNGWTPFEIKLSAKSLQERVLGFFENIDHTKRLRFADSVICVSEAIANKASLFNKNAMFIPNGVDTRLFSPQSKLEARAKLGLPENCFIIGYIGAMEKWHEILPLVESMIELRDADILSVFVGEGHEKYKAMQLADRLGVIDKCKFLPAVEIAESAEIFPAFDMSYVSLVKELHGCGWPIKLSNSVSCGTPVIASDNDSFRIVEERCAGILIDTSDSHSIANSVRGLIQDKQRLKNMSESARIWALEELEWSEIARKIQIHVIEPLKKSFHK